MSAAEHLNPTQFFHGSHDRLKTGDILTPGHQSNHVLSRTDVVYVHPDPGIAQVFANDFHGSRGTVYEVEPHRPVPVMSHDPWASEHLTSKATVKRVVPPDEIRRISDRIDER